MYLGIKIEQGNLDGVFIPTYNSRLSLSDNSIYLSDTLPIDCIRKIHLNPNGTHIYRMIHCKVHDIDNQPQSLTMRDAIFVIQPQFATTNLRSRTPQVKGAVPTPLFNSAKSGFTFSAFPLDETPTIPKNYVFLWSSYRHIKDRRLPKSKVFYTTLNPSYGQSTLLHKTNNPCKLIPDSDCF